MINSNYGNHGSHAISPPNQQGPEPQITSQPTHQVAQLQQPSSLRHTSADANKQLKLIYLLNPIPEDVEKLAANARGKEKHSEHSAAAQQQPSSTQNSPPLSNDGERPVTTSKHKTLDKILNTPDEEQLAKKRAANALSARKCRKNRTPEKIAAQRILGAQKAKRWREKNPEKWKALKKKSENQLVPDPRGTGELVKLRAVYDRNTRDKKKQEKAQEKLQQEGAA